MGEGSETYKYRYSNACRENLTFTVHAPDITGRVMRARGEAVSAARGRARIAVEWTIREF